MGVENLSEILGSLGRIKAWIRLLDASAARISSEILESLSTAINRGVANLDDVLNSVTIPQINSNTIQHIFRGNPIGHANPTGGFHHVSSVISRPDIRILDRTPIGPHGCYRSTLEFPNGRTDPKDFFPDSWDEARTMQEIEYAFANRTQPAGFPSGHYLGYSSDGVPIRIVFSGNRINSAFPELP